MPKMQVGAYVYLSEWSETHLNENLDQYRKRIIADIETTVKRGPPLRIGRFTIYSGRLRAIWRRLRGRELRQVGEIKWIQHLPRAGETDPLTSIATLGGKVYYEEVRVASR